MTVRSQFAEFAVDQLSGLGQVLVRRMFGGAGLYLDGTMFALIADDTLYLKVDDTNRPDFEALGSSPFQPFPDKPMTMPYYPVTADLLEDRSRLTLWASRALSVARRGKRR